MGVLVFLVSLGMALSPVYVIDGNTTVAVCGTPENAFVCYIDTTPPLPLDSSNPSIHARNRVLRDMA